MSKSKGHNPHLFDALVKVPDFNIQVSQSKSRNDARSESVVAVNPLNSSNLVGASKEFTDIQNYEFTLAAYYSVDGGLTWNQSPALELFKGSHNLSDPAMAWDNAGNAYLFGLPLGPAPGLNFQGLVVYKSTDGGRNWGRPTLINQNQSSDPNVGDDKPWAIGDYNPASSHFGNVYVAWDDIQPGTDGTWLVFARSTDHGNHWRGLGNQPITALGGVTDSFSPELAVGPDGILYIFWIDGSQIKFMRSADGGDTFTAPAVAVSGLSPLFGGGSSFPEFPPGKFRVETFPTVCTGSAGRVMVAWSDSREEVARIYYRRSTNGGATWEGPLFGQPLLTGALADNIGLEMNHFHPQLEGKRDGTIACAYYEFGPKRSFIVGNKLGKVYLIDVILVMSIDDGQSFPLSLTVTDAPWDPGVDAPLSHGHVDTTFIGDYFGLGVSDEGFYPFWTDTRTGRQDIFVSRVALMAPGEVPRRIIDGAVLQILFGVTADGGGKGLTASGGVVIVPPRQPVRDILYSLAIYELGRAMQDRTEGTNLEAAAMHAISEAAQRQAQPLEQGKAESPALGKPTRRKLPSGRRRIEKA